MSIWDSIKNAFKDLGNKIAGAGETAYDAVKGAAEQGALTLADGANLFSNGWQDVFSGHFKDGLSKIAVGFAEAAGLVPAQMAARYEDAIGQASLWSLQESKRKNGKTCFSAYRDQVKAKIAALGLTWNEGMEAPLRDGVTQMPWIDPGC